MSRMRLTSNGMEMDMVTKLDWESTAAIVEPPAELMPDAAGRSAIIAYTTTPQPPGSIAKALVVALLAALLELSPALAMALGRGVLWAWPGLRKA
jgi:hypothetical protein